MAKRIILLMCFLFTILYGYGQDIITRTDGVIIEATILEATILEVKPSLIRFRLFNSADSLIYQINSADVQSIQMADGSTRTFTPTATGQTSRSSFNYETNFGRNILSFAPLDLIFSNLSFAYERIMPSGKVGFKIPVLIGLSQYYDRYSTGFRASSLFGTGLEIKFYPKSQGKLRYYLAPAFHIRSFSTYYYHSNASAPTYPTAYMYTTALKSGGYYMLSKILIVSIDMGLGLRFFQLPKQRYFIYPEYNTRPFVPGNLHLGLRF